MVSSVISLMSTPTNLGKFFSEGVDKVAKYFSSVVDFFGIFSNDPYERSSSIWLVQFVDALAERGYDSLIAGVFAEDVLNNHNCFLNDVVDFGVDKVKKRVDTLLAGTLDLDGHLSNGLDSSSHEIHIHLHGIFLQFREQLIDVFVVRYPNHNLELLHLQVGRIVVFAEEDTHLFTENVCLLLEEEIDVSESDVLYFGSG